jgi:hypothetical protein
MKEKEEKTVYSAIQILPQGIEWQEEHSETYWQQMKIFSFFIRNAHLRSLTEMIYDYSNYSWIVSKKLEVDFWEEKFTFYDSILLNIVKLFDEGFFV